MSKGKALTATLLVASRHHVKFKGEDGSIIKGGLASRKMKALIGDRVEYFLTENNKAVVEKILPRTNCFKRSYGNKTKNLAANIDQLFLVTAPKPLFSPFVIDRVLAAAHSQSIECTLVLNKSDLNLEETKSLLDYYKDLGFRVLHTNTVNEGGASELEECIKASNYKAAALIGVSGVGKTSLLNVLCPQAQARTGEVSERSGKGKQTTSMSKGYYYSKHNNKQILLIDLPGIQNFGISHLRKEQIRDSFIEFGEQKNNCKFNNCAHIEEPECEILKAIEQGTISKERYNSYLEMLQEIET